MILRRYGSAYHSVETNFNPMSITEIGFMRDRAFSVPAADFAERYEMLDAGELVADASAPVQRHAERDLLRNLERALAEWVARLEPGQVLVVRNGRDDWPKTRERREAVIVEGENRFHFHWWVDPPLKVAIHAPR